jgi:hypothetical protein
MPPPPPHKKRRQEHDAKNPQLEEPRRVRLGGGHGNDRTKEDIEKISHVYLDMDHGGTASLEALENSDLVPRPNYVLNTSPEKYK